MPPCIHQNKSKHRCAHIYPVNPDQRKQVGLNFQNHIAASIPWISVYWVWFYASNSSVSKAKQPRQVGQPLSHLDFEVRPAPRSTCCRGTTNRISLAMAGMMPMIGDHQLQVSSLCELHVWERRFLSRRHRTRRYRGHRENQPN
jgi:hypothetical protein